LAQVLGLGRAPASVTLICKYPPVTPQVAGMADTVHSIFEAQDARTRAMHKEILMQSTHAGEGKRDLLMSPSQMSTAPPTPLRQFVHPSLSGDLSHVGDSFSRFTTEDCMASPCMGPQDSIELVPMESPLGKWALSAIEVEEMGLEMPALESALGKWALSAVEKEEITGESTRACSEEDDDAQRGAVLCIGHPPLQSKLAIWAQAMVRWEERLEKELLRIGMAETAELMDEEEDSELSADWDGPALMPDGCVVDLDGGAPIFFSHQKELSSGFEEGQRRRLMTQLGAKVRMAEFERQASADVDDEEVCSMDADGLVRGSLSLSSATTSAAKAARSASSRKSPAEDLVLCADETGKISWYLSLPAGKQEKMMRKIRRSLRKQRALAPGSQEDKSSLYIVDANGTIYADDDC